MTFLILVACGEDCEECDDSDSQKVTELQGKVDTLEQEKTTLSAKVTELEGTIDDLEDEMSDLEGTIDDLEAELAELAEQYEKLKDQSSQTNGSSSQTPECKKEGETIPVIPNAPECCEGLTLIPPKDPIVVGISGICTAKCGDGTCDTQTESEHNCPADCQSSTTSGTKTTTTPPSGNVVGTTWVYAVNYDCDEVGVQGNQITLANDTEWTMTVTGIEDVEGAECYVTESTVDGDAKRRYPYPGGMMPAIDVPVTLAPEGTGPTVYRAMDHGDIVKESFPLLANAMGGINLDVARDYAQDERPSELSDGASWTYGSVVDLATFAFFEEMTWDAKVTGIESVTVPMGTYDCYKVEAKGTGGENPDATNYFWWDVNGEFVCPVKYQYNYIFLGSETKELSSYTPGS